MKSYNIKVPVFASEIIQKDNDLFGITIENVINQITNRIDNFNSNPKDVIGTRKNKTTERKINRIHYEKHQLGNETIILLRISAYITNLLDGYFETDQKVNFSKNDKIGSDNNFIMLYPRHFGIKENSFQWVILIYEDPNKESSDIISTAKLVLEKILEIKMVNIKLKTVLEEIRTHKSVPFIELKLTSMSNEKNDVDVKYADYYLEGKYKTIREDSFINMPFDDSISLIEDKSFFNDFSFKQITLHFGKKEYKISETHQEAKDKFKQVVEELYNSHINISENDLQKNVYDPIFVINKLKDILYNYIESSNENDN